MKSACRTTRKRVLELEGFHFHILRHACTTNLLFNRAQPKDVQELLGHSDVSTTMNVYAHATREKDTYFEVSIVQSLENRGNLWKKLTNLELSFLFSLSYTVCL